MESNDASFEDVETLLESDLEDFENELDALYNQIERYARVADAMDSAGRGADADYFRELAVESYGYFVDVIQLEKMPEEDF